MIISIQNNINVTKIQPEIKHRTIEQSKQEQISKNIKISKYIKTKKLLKKNNLNL
jgi:hypothetical protein